MKQTKYVKQIEKKLNCGKKRKAEIIKELEADIQAAMEQGESWEAVELRMGTPSSQAAEFNEGFSEEEKKKSRKEKRTRVIGGVVLGLILVIALGYWMLPKTSELEAHGHYSEEQVVADSEEIIRLLDSEDYEALQERCIEQLKTSMNAETMGPVKEKLSDHWGELESFSSIYTAEIRQMNHYYAVIQINGIYENLAVTYTLSFDEAGVLAGLYMK